MAEREFDEIVVGGGPAGEVAAGRLADAGESVALVEQHLVGGECSFYACMPSKALLRPAALLAEVERVPGIGAGDGIDVERVLARRDEVIHDLDDSGQLPWLEERDIELLRDRGRLDGERRVRVGDDVLVARKAIIVATGSGPAIPPIDGLDAAHAWSNREATLADAAPSSLIVLGGGPVGVELAQAWSSLGTDVVLVESAERILGNEEPFVSEQVAEALTGRGVRVLADTKGTEVRGGGAEPFTLSLDDGGEVGGERLLVAIGREPRVSDLGLESVGINPDGPIDVDDRMRAGGRDWLYAVGDVNGRVLLTHMGKYQARVAVDNILGRDAVVRGDDSRSPRVVFTDPEVAAVGYTLAAARDAGIGAEEVDVATAGTAGASFHGRNAPGTSRLVIDPERRIVVGATFVGPDANELLHAATIAVTGEVPLERLAEAIPAFPTRNEIWLNLLGAYGL